MRVPAFVLLLGALAIAPAAAVQPAPAASEADEPFFSDLAGREVRLSDLRGSVVLLNFWATWCGPCRTEMPSFARLHAKYAGQGVRVVAVAANGKSEAEAVRAAAKDLGVTFDVWLWATAKDMRHYGVGPGIPATLLVDREGRVVQTFQGVIDETLVAGHVDELLAGPARKSAED